MTSLYIILGLIVIGIIYMRIEASMLKVETIRFTKDKNALKVIHLSDIHINHLKVSTQKVKSVIENEKPDVIVITGDYIEKPKHIPKFIDFINTIKGENKVLLSFGNHDYEAFKNDNNALKKYFDDMRALGITVVYNDCICIEKNTKKYNFIGIEDIRYNQHDIEKALKARNKDAFCNIGFSHNPDVILEVPKGELDYLFCGHFHGGQIWAPFDLEFKLLRREKLCKMGVRRGLHKMNNINFYISRGIGNVCFPLRFLSRPEITIFYLP